VEAAPSAHPRRAASSTPVDMAPALAVERLPPMTSSRTHLGDPHNFGRRTSLRGGRIVKPRTLVWERLVLSGDSPLRRLLDEAAGRDGLGSGAFGFLPDLAFFRRRARIEGEVERIELAPLPEPSSTGRRALATIVGRALALFAWLGVTDLHWENLVLGVDDRGRVVFTPLDIEMILADLSLPTETKLLPDADPEYAAICRHACGVRRVLPYLGKPVPAADLLAMAGSYRSTLAFLDRHASAIALVFAGLPGLEETPIRVCLRGTGDYVRARSEPVWPPLLDAEAEQLARGDIPYFFRLYGEPGIRYYGDRALRRIDRIPLRGDVPRLDPLLSPSRGLRSPHRKRLREDGLFTLLGAFDHASLTGRHENDDLAVTFRARTLVVRLPTGEELCSRRDLEAFVGSVYLPCRCGEVRSVFVPPVTACDAEEGGGALP
jgi:hypothetical protein